MNPRIHTCVYLITLQYIHAYKQKHAYIPASRHAHMTTRWAAGSARVRLQLLGSARG